MDAEIQFGEVEQVQPERRLRPDRNRHYAIADYATPDDSELAVFIDMDEDRESWQTLGDGYRVEARISVWEGKDVLRVPASAVFRSDESWAAFVVEAGKATLRAVELGESNGIETEVLSGLEEGEMVIAYPSDSVRDGVSVEAR